MTSRLSARRSHPLALGLCLSVLLMGPVLAEAPTSDPMVAYRAYNGAIEAGKISDAATYAQEAWKLAEAKWPPTNPKVPALAFNAAWSLALADRAAEGLGAAQRALELAGNEKNTYQPDEAAFLVANANFYAAPVEKKRAAAQALGLAAAKIEANWSDMLVADSLIAASTILTLDGRSEQATELADRGLSQIMRLDPSDDTRRSRALLARAISKLTKPSLRLRAYQDVLDARVAYGPMRSVDDLTWGTFSAWQILTGAMIQSTYVQGWTSGATPKYLDDFRTGVAPEEWEKIDPVPQECRDVAKFERLEVGEKIKPRTYGTSGINIAGVHVRADLAPDGRVLQPRVLGVAPDARYGEAARIAIQTWQYRIPPNTPAICLKDFDITLSFVTALPFRVRR